jgi:hypothetical protein
MSEALCSTLALYEVELERRKRVWAAFRGLERCIAVFEDEELTPELLRSMTPAVCHASLLELGISLDDAELCKKALRGDESVVAAPTQPAVADALLDGSDTDPLLGNLDPMYGMPESEVSGFREYTSDGAPPESWGEAADTLLQMRPRRKSHRLSLGQARLDPEAVPAHVHRWMAGLGECADMSCGCCRLARPEVRPRFRDFVADVVRERWDEHSGAAVRAPSLASLHALADPPRMIRCATRRSAPASCCSTLRF